jgi:toxin CptA
MHNAPSVSYPVGRCRFAGVLAGVLWCLGGGAVGAWAWRSAAEGQPVGVVAAVWLTCGLLAARAWWAAPSGLLAWDGAGWNWAGEGLDAAQPQIALDLQRWLLLRLRGGNVPGWLWLERGRDPQHWDALRRAVYSRARTAAPQGAQPPVA